MLLHLIYTLIVFNAFAFTSRLENLDRKLAALLFILETSALTFNFYGFGTKFPIIFIISILLITVLPCF